MPRRETQFSVNAPPEALWAFIRDIESLCTCVPGVEKVVMIDERTADLTVKEKVGVIPMIVTLRATIDAEDPPRWLQATARAEHLTMAIEVALEPGVGTTQLRGVFDVVGTGQLKPIVDKLFEKRATERAAQFGASLEQRFGAATAAVDVEASGGEPQTAAGAAVSGMEAGLASAAGPLPSPQPMSPQSMSSPPMPPPPLPPQAASATRPVHWWSAWWARLRRAFSLR